MRCRARAEANAARASVFAAVGVLGFAVQIAAFLALTRFAGCPYPVATAVAVECAVLHNFIWHQRWTWADRRAPAGTVLRLLRFNATNGLVSLLGNLGLMGVFVGLLGFDERASALAAVAALALANFVVADRWVFRPPAAGALVFIVIALRPWCAAASQPGADTLSAWDRYCTATEARLERGAATGAISDRAALTNGEIVITDASAAGSGPRVEVPSGTIQHWRGAVFIPGVTLDRLLDRLEREPPSGDGVVSARILARTPGRVRVYLRLVRRQIVEVTYDTEHETIFRRSPPRVATSRSVMTRIAEVDGAGTPHERQRPPDDDRGFLWRWRSYGRYTSVAGGVVVEVESVTLSRYVPLLLRPIAAPIISHMARESMWSTLDAMRRRLAAVATTTDGGVPSR